MIEEKDVMYGWTGADGRAYRMVWLVAGELRIDGQLWKLQIHHLGQWMDMTEYNMILSLTTTQTRS